jgi:iron(III) transport system ATP-binding protein
MRDGHIRQVGLPDDVYAAPVSPWVAKFLGDAVLFDGTVSGGSVSTVLGSVPTVLPDGVDARVMIRPEWITPTTAGNGTGLVIDREFYGHDQRVEIELVDGEIIEALVPTRHAVHVGDRVNIELADSIVYEV